MLETGAPCMAPLSPSLNLVGLPFLGGDLVLYLGQRALVLEDLFSCKGPTSQDVYPCCVYLYSSS